MKVCPVVKSLRLETARLLIRPYVPEDLMECFRLMQDEALFAHLDMQVMTLEEYRELFAWLLSCYAVGFDGDFKYSFNILLKETGAHVGWVGIGGADFDHAVKEIYWLIGRQYWNRGYATEAAAALLHYGFCTMGLERIQALCKKENVASRKVMEHIGLEYAGVLQGLPAQHDFYNGELQFALTREKYCARKHLHRTTKELKE